MLTKNIRERLKETKRGKNTALLVALISLFGVLFVPYVTDSLDTKHAYETQTVVSISLSQTADAKRTEIAGYTLTPTLTPTATLTPTLTPTPTIGFATEPDRDPEEITYCLQDVLNPAGIRVIARWPTQNKRGFYIAAEKRTGIVYFRVTGWDYLPSTQLNNFIGEQNSGICGSDTQWLVWSDSHSTDAVPGSIISIEFLDVNQKIIVTITFSVNMDGDGLNHINIVR